VALPVASDTGTMPVCAPPRAHTNIIEASWLVNGGHGASLRHHTRRQTDRQTQPCPASPQTASVSPGPTTAGGYGAARRDDLGEIGFPRLTIGEIGFPRERGDVAQHISGAVPAASRYCPRA
jgi:hypothetical protein